MLRRALRRIPLWVGIGLLLVVVVVFDIGLLLKGEVLSSKATYQGVSLGGLNYEEAHSVLEEYQNDIKDAKYTFSVAGEEFTITPAELQFDLQSEKMLPQYLKNLGEDVSIVRTSIAGWQSLPFRRELVGRGEIIEAEQLQQDVLRTWEQAVGLPLPEQGSLSLDGTEIAKAYPQAGQEVDVHLAHRVLLGTILANSSETVVLQVVDKAARRNNRDIDQAAEKLGDFISKKISLGNNSFSHPKINLTRELLAGLVVIENDISKGKEISFGINHDAVDDIVESYVTKDAYFDTTNDTVSIVPGVSGFEYDYEKLHDDFDSLLENGRHNEKFIELPIVAKTEPDFSEEDAEKLEINHLVSSFTTYHPCCEDRAVNIARIADIVDGTIVKPWGTFDINDQVGERTLERGFLPAGTIIAGQIVDTVGGGVSQFATTLYNAIFWGGYRDIAHMPHGRYFDRYPEGIEATMSWPYPDLIFQNNTTSGLLIRAEHTPTSITVKFFGDNDGRIVKGKQAGKTTYATVTEPGGVNARKVEGTVSDRHTFRDFSKKCVASEGVPVGSYRESQKGEVGWTVDVERLIQVEGTHDTIEQWEVIYRPVTHIIKVNPAELQTHRECR